MPYRQVSVRPEGGYLDECAWAGQAAKLAAWKGPARTMFPWEFLELLRRHKHPRFDSCGILMSRHGNNPRKAYGLTPHGTIWFSKFNERREVMAIPYGSIPYATIRTARWDEDRMYWVDGELLRGWRSALSMLIKHGYLAPHEDLNYLIGEDTFTTFPKWARR